MNDYFKMIICKTRPLKNQAGFTLVEMVAAIVLMGIMGLFSIQFITGAAESNRLVSGQKGLMDDAKLAMEFLVRELRVANIDLNNSGAVINVTGTPGNHIISFTKYNGLTVDGNTAITYRRVGDTIQRTGAVTTTLASRVTGFTVTSAVTNNSTLYTIVMTFAGDNGANFNLEAGVRPRSTID
jgi:prepilin-type N-terminal cleavage/methylation domain-containing protein